MREIKFKAWLKKEQKMATYISHIKSGGDGIWEISVPFDESGIHHYRIDMDEAILMQYTGLKDKNGKEIYEGDIVCWVTDVVVDSEGGFNRTEPEGQIGKVEFSNGAFWVNGKEFEFYSYGEQNFLWSELQVIGNVYENSDLLK